MILKKLQLRNFRNYEKIGLEFHEGINCILGKNAQGKTNLLESIYYLSTMRSHRCRDDGDLFCSGSDFFMIDALINKRKNDVSMRCISSSAGKKLFVYSQPVKRLSDFIGECNAVLFCPDDMGLFSAQPRVRRRFIDLELSKLSKSYMSLMNEFMKLLKERNAYLKSERVSKEFLSVLDERLSLVQCKILKQRTSFMKDLLNNCIDFYHDVSKDNTDLNFEYHTFVDSSLDEKRMQEEIFSKHQESLDRDILFKTTNLGIHRDDFTFLINGRDVDVYASQGQKRTILLALKVGIVSLIYQIKKESPILLLDDVFSELDEFRRLKLLEVLPMDVQIFISATEMSEFPKNRMVHIYKVTDGTIVS